MGHILAGDAVFDVFPEKAQRVLRGFPVNRNRPLAVALGIQEGGKAVQPGGVVHIFLVRTFFKRLQRALEALHCLHSVPGRAVQGGQVVIGHRYLVHMAGHGFDHPERLLQAADRLRILFRFPVDQRHIVEHACIRIGILKPCAAVDPRRFPEQRNRGVIILCQAAGARHVVQYRRILAGIPAGVQHRQRARLFKGGNRLRIPADPPVKRAELIIYRNQFVPAALRRFLCLPDAFQQEPLDRRKIPLEIFFIQITVKRLQPVPHNDPSDLCI